MENLLFLCHRLPYPPDKGDKIRSFHILQFLARHYKIHLGTFIDDPADLKYQDKVGQYCTDLCAVPIQPVWRRLESLRGLLTGEALGLPYYRDTRLAQWLARTVQAHTFSRVLIFSSTMAQYVMGPKFDAMRLVVDFVDVDSEKWRAYAAAKPWPIRALYRREAKKLFAYEQRLAKRAQASLFVSAAEARLFNFLLDEPLTSVSHVDNGVDLDYFARTPGRANPYPTRNPVLVFTGAMDYWANVDAVSWFAHTIFPQVRQRCPDAEFWIVGSRPTAEVQVLARRAGVYVTGSVPDVRPFLQYARGVVAPLRIARGVQNKVLEAMAMEKHVVGTPEAFEGIEAAESAALYHADDAAHFATLCVALLEEGIHATGNAGRAYVQKAHDWNRNLQKLQEVLEA